MCFQDNYDDLWAEMNEAPDDVHRTMHMRLENEDLQRSYKKIQSENKELKSVVASYKMDQVDKAALQDELNDTKKKLQNAKDKIREMEVWFFRAMKNKKFNLMIKETSETTETIERISLPELPGAFLTAKDMGYKVQSKSDTSKSLVKYNPNSYIDKMKFRKEIAAAEESPRKGKLK